MFFQENSLRVLSAKVFCRGFLNPAGESGAARYMRTSASGPLNRRSQAIEVGLLQKGFKISGDPQNGNLLWEKFIRYNLQGSKTVLPETFCSANHIQSESSFEPLAPSDELWHEAVCTPMIYEN